MAMEGKILVATLTIHKFNTRQDHVASNPYDK